VDRALAAILDRDPPELIQTPWHQAMKYSLFSGGKRLRPILAIAAAETFTADIAGVIPIACALELIHTYSLIHDDLPALDNDTLRRGRPTCHTVYGVQTAIEAGLGLLIRAHTTLRQAARDDAGSADALGEAAIVIFRAAGIEGMVGGQIADLLAEKQPVDLDEVRYIHRNKTAALIRASVLAGCIFYCHDIIIREKYASYGEKIGLAFQIIDDVLDLVSETEVLGKNALSDVQRGKATYPSLTGIDQARRDARELVEEAVAELRTLDRPVESLVNLAYFLCDRKM
jgi:geranylgeranyl diphosphate synthase, type II